MYQPRALFITVILPPTRGRKAKACENLPQEQLELLHLEVIQVIKIDEDEEFRQKPLTKPESNSAVARTWSSSGWHADRAMLAGKAAQKAQDIAEDAAKKARRDLEQDKDKGT